MQKDKKFYDDFFTHHSVNVHNFPSRFSAVANLLSGRVLDVACGTGTLADYFTGYYYGVDVSDVAIKKARVTRRKDASFRVHDYTQRVSFAGEQFDCAYLGEFLEHIENDEVVFENLLQAVKKDGRIIVSVPNGDRVPDESHCRVFTVPQIRRYYSRYGKITFHNWDGFANRILFSIDLGKVNSDDITLVMIVKDEQKGLEKAVLSALPIVDRVVISVDSLSQDKTRDIALMYADDLKTHIWENDFSRARNQAQENVSSKWILFLDGHEYIESYGDFASKINDDVDGIFVTIRMESGMTFLFPRIYRSHIKFKNAVHNVNECATRRISPEFVIVHDRENLQDEAAILRRNAQRDEMLVPAMEQQIKDNPKNARAYFHLANYYMMRQLTDLAIKNYKLAIKYGKSADEKYVSLLHYGSLMLSKGHSFRALWSFNKANELLPGRWESARVLGGFYMLQKNYKKALDYFVDSLSDNKRRYAYQPMVKKQFEIWDMIGYCFARLNKNAEAVSAWTRASELAENDQQKNFFQEKIKLVSSLIKS